jgi:hypothetical protein
MHTSSMPYKGHSEGVRFLARYSLCAMRGFALPVIFPGSAEALIVALLGDETINHYEQHRRNFHIISYSVSKHIKLLHHIIH